MTHDNPRALIGWDEQVHVGQSRSHRLLARALAAVGVLVAVAIAVGVVLALGKASTQPFAVRQGWEPDVDQLRSQLTAGVCVDQVHAGSVDTLTPVDCRHRHDGEILGTGTLRAGPWPGEDQVLQQSQETCGAAFDTWVVDASHAPSDLEISFFYPSQSGWADAHPTVLCFVVGSRRHALTARLGPSSSA